MTDEPKWPRGPWAIDSDEAPGMQWNNHIVSADDPNNRICFMAHSVVDNSAHEAAAHLIAEAPELYAAIDMAIESSNGATPLPETTTISKESLRRMRRALARARCESQ